MGVTVPTLSAAGDNHAVTSALQVAENMAAVAIADDRAGRDVNIEVVGIGTGAVGTLTMLAPFRSPVALARQMSEIREALHGADDHVPAASAVTAIGAAPGRIFLAPEAEAAVASIAPADLDRHAVDKHDRLPPFEMQPRVCSLSLSQPGSH